MQNVLKIIINDLGGSVVKNLPVNAGDSIPGSGSSPGEGNGNPLQYSCLKNAMDRGAWWAAVYGVAKSRTQLIGWIRVHAGPTYDLSLNPHNTHSFHSFSAVSTCLSTS